MAEADDGVVGASCLAHLCISRSVTADHTLEHKAQELDPRFRLVDIFTDRDKDDRVLFAHLAHPCFDLIAFPTSTSSRRDWRNSVGNLKTKMESIAHYGRELSGCEAHAGFVAAVDEMWAPLEAALWRRPQAKVVFCGSSRGGALAVLAALRFGSSRRLGAVVTFAQPRVVNERATAIFEEVWGRRYFRFAGFLDPVPLLPRGGGYSHGRTLLHVTDDGTVDYRGYESRERSDVLSNAFEDAVRDPLGSLVTACTAKGHKHDWYEEKAAYLTLGIRKTEAMQALLNRVIMVPEQIAAAVGSYGSYGSQRPSRMSGGDSHRPPMMDDGGNHMMGGGSNHMMGGGSNHMVGGAGNHRPPMMKRPHMPMAAHDGHMQMAEAAMGRRRYDAQMDVPSMHMRYDAPMAGRYRNESMSPRYGGDSSEHMSPAYRRNVGSPVTPVSSQGGSAYRREYGTGSASDMSSRHSGYDGNTSMMPHVGSMYGAQGYGAEIEGRMQQRYRRDEAGSEMSDHARRRMGGMRDSRSYGGDYDSRY